MAPVSRWHEVDGRRIQGWFLEAPRRDGRPAPLVVEIHGGPATLYGWSLMWEWQCLVAAGISVYACNPRGSQGYGQDFAYANLGGLGRWSDARRHGWRRLRSSPTAWWTRSGSASRVARMVAISPRG